MKKINFIAVVLFIITLAIPYIGQSQTNTRESKKRLKTANKFYFNNEFDEALPFYLLLEEDYQGTEDEAELNYKVGFCYYRSVLNKDKCIPYFNQYLAKNDSIFEAYFFIAKTHHFYNRFDNAIENYVKFRAYVVKDSINDPVVVKGVLSSVDNEIQRCNYGKLLLKSPVDVVIENLSEINSIYSEYAPVISYDEKWMVFTKRSPETTGGKKQEGEEGDFFEDIYIVKINEGSLFKKSELDSKNRSGYFSALKTFKSSAPKKK